MKHHPHNFPQGSVSKFAKTLRHLNLLFMNWVDKINITIAKTVEEWCLIQHPYCSCILWESPSSFLVLLFVLTIYYSILNTSVAEVE